jgi:hypothetical protein
MTTSRKKNATTHGAYAQIIAPPPKTNPRFDKLHDKLVRHFMPSGPLQKNVVRDLTMIWLQKRDFDRCHTREFSAFLRDINADERMRANLQESDDLDEKIAELEHAFNAKSVKLAKRVIVAKGQHAVRLRAEIAALEQARNNALAPLHASRERERLAREDSPHLRKLERVEKARATVEGKFDRCLRRLAMAKTFDELHTAKLLEHQPTKSPINATARQAKVIDRESDDEEEREREQDQSNPKTPKNKNVGTGSDFSWDKKSKTSEDGEDW